MRPAHGSRPHRHRHRPASAPPASSLPLAEIARAFDAWRQAQPGPPACGALREYWRAADAQHGSRPDYLLWRHLHAGESPPEKRQDPGETALRALKSRDPAVLRPTVLLVAGWLLEGRAGDLQARLVPALQEALARLDSGAGKESIPGLEVWLARAALGGDAAARLTEAAAWWDWKAGRELVLPPADSAPVPPRVLTRWVVAAVHSLSPNPAWQYSAWRLLRRLRPEGALIRPEEWERLLAAASSARGEGALPEALRLTTLALHLLPERAPETLRRRARVAAWFLAESGLELPAALHVSLDEMPFPGDAPASEAGRAARHCYGDEADPFWLRLQGETETEADWQVLRTAGVALHHPLAALAWVARRAQAHVLKKQQALLQAAARLALRHQLLVTLARLRADCPESAEAVLELARAWRDNQRQLPLLRDAAAEQRVTGCLRAAWGRLEAGAVQDEEALFFLHETLLDRASTLQNCLPADLQALVQEHPQSARRPSRLIQALDAEPKRMRVLEHQRVVELWSVASLVRERADLADAVWVSCVRCGEAGSGKYSWIVLGAAGRRLGQGRLRAAGETAPLQAELAAAVRDASPEARRMFLAADADLAEPCALESVLPGLEILRIPSWEWQFRALRS